MHLLGVMMMELMTHWRHSFSKNWLMCWTIVNQTWKRTPADGSLHLLDHTSVYLKMFVLEWWMTYRYNSFQLYFLYFFALWRQFISLHAAYSGATTGFTLPFSHFLLKTLKHTYIYTQLLELPWDGSSADDFQNNIQYKTVTQTIQPFFSDH